MQEQAEGYIPWDEPFCYEWVGTANEQGEIVDWPYDLSGPARSQIADAWLRGVARQPLDEQVIAPRGGKWTEAYGVLPLTSGGYLIEPVRLRTFRFGAVSPRELAEELATVNVAECLQRYEHGDYTPHSAEQLASVRRLTQGWSRVGMLLKDVPFPYDDLESSSAN